MIDASSRLARIILEHATEALMTHNLTIGICRRIFLQEFVANPLVVSFEVVVGNVFSHGMPKLSLAEEYHAIQTL